MPKISPITTAIRQALQELGLDAPTDEVKKRVLKIDGSLKNVPAMETFPARCSQQRMLMNNAASGEAEDEPAVEEGEAGETPREGGRRRRRKAAVVAKPPVSARDRFDMAQRVWALCGGNIAHAEEILGYLQKVDAGDLYRGFESLKRLVATTGSMEKAREAMDAMTDLL